MSLHQYTDYLAVVYDEKRRPRTAYPGQLARYLFDRFSLKSGMTLLEAGCGRGEVMEGFHRLGLQVSGIDGSPAAVEMLRAYAVRQVDLDQGIFPFPDNTFDVVYSKSVIEHFHDPSHFLSECIRVLKPAGQLITLTPDWVSQMPIFFDDYTHRTPFTVESLRDMLHIFGLKNVTSEKFYQLPILWRCPPLKACGN